MNYKYNQRFNSNVLDTAHLPIYDDWNFIQSSPTDIECEIIGKNTWSETKHNLQQYLRFNISNFILLDSKNLSIGGSIKILLNPRV